MITAPFSFVSLTHLADHELELIPPESKWIDAILRECNHPLTARQDPRLARTTRQSLLDFLRVAPGGLVMGDEQRGTVPGYYFWMRWRDPATQRYRIAGGISVRVGYTAEIEQYSGHIGYHVYPTARGKHFAERACRLIRPLLKHYQIQPTWITVNPDNLPSKRTCQRLGAVYIDTVAVPVTHPFYQRGETHKCRYRWDI